MKVLYFSCLSLHSEDVDAASIKFQKYSNTMQI
jgi:hypothetical protein